MRPAGPRPGFVRGTWRSVVDLYEHRELLDLLIRRELKARYKDSVLGFFWSLARPLAMLLVYYVAIGKFLGAEQTPTHPQGVPGFAVFIYAGLTAWQLFSDIVTGGTGSIVANSGLVKKVYVPREVYPLSVVGAALFNFGIQMVILLTATAFMGGFPTGGRWGYFVLAFGVLLLWSMALGLLLGAINVYLRDVQYLVEILIMILMWASPIVYAWKFVAHTLHGAPLDLYLANPMTQVVLGFQRSLWVAGTDEPFPVGLGKLLLISLAVSAVLLWVSQRVFARLQSNFAQEL